MGCGGSKYQDEIVSFIDEPRENFVENKDRSKSDKLIHNIEHSCDQMDLNENDYLSKEELKQGYSNGEFEISDEGVDFIMEKMDTKEDGRVSKG